MSGGGRFIVDVPVDTVSEANRRDHWAKKAKRVRDQRGVTALLLRSCLPRIDAGDLVAVHLIRSGPRLLDTDNLAGALKAVRDETAAHLGIDDGPGGVTWTYDQRKGAPGVHVEIAVKGDGK